MRNSRARMSQRIREGRIVSVVTRLSRAAYPWEYRCRIIQTPGSHDTSRMSGGRPDWSPVLAQRAVADSPRWTRAVGDQCRPPSWRNDEDGERAGMFSLLAERAAREGWGGGQVLSLLAERARSECARSMRAVEGSLGHSPKREVESNSKALVEQERKTGSFCFSDDSCLANSPPRAVFVVRVSLKI